MTADPTVSRLNEEINPRWKLIFLEGDGVNTREFSAINAKDFILSSNLIFRGLAVSEGDRKMPLIRNIFCTILMAASGQAVAQIPLTPSDCKALQEAYGVTRDECRAIVSGSPIEDATEPKTPELSHKAMENNIFFPEGGSTLDEAALAQVRTLAKVLETPILRQSCIRLVGHADRTGDSSVNERLSRLRALAVAGELRLWLMNPYRIRETHGAGDTQALDELSPSDPENRRVTIYAKNCD